MKVSLRTREPGVAKARMGLAEARFQAFCDGVRHGPVTLLTFSGARIGEIAQLWGKGITIIDGVPVMKIVLAEDGGSLKNANSERTVPIHPAVIERGFLEFVRYRPRTRRRPASAPPCFTGPSSERAGRCRCASRSHRLAFHRRRPGTAAPRAADRRPTFGFGGPLPAPRMG
ncbi:hypothetical protein [Rhodovulum sp. PH10]|uniref:hypothetical protein n=1 Tax=Rhodovulum sp. PH10 TaxID=1187851 RepID=UPI0012F7FB99|nr:hypothetical protein [Rhodovulum sp. PH10]